MFHFINLLPYYFILNMALNDLEVDQLTRWHLALLFVPLFASLSFLKSASKTLDPGDPTKEEAAAMDDKAMQKFYSNIIIGAAVKNGLALVFLLHILFLIFPFLLRYIGF